MDHGILAVSGTPEYYIRDLDLTTFPTIGQVTPGNIAVTLEMMNPEIDHDEAHLRCDGVLEVELFVIRNGGEEEEVKEEFGSVESEFTVIHKPEGTTTEGEKEEWIEVIEEQVEVWEEEGYRSVAEPLQFELESELFSEIFVPLAQLLNNQFRGIIPRVMFRPPQEGEETEEESEQA